MTMTPSSEEMRDAAERLFAGPGELRALCRAHDWSTTPLGPVATWSSSLRTAVQLVLAHPFPNVVLWGPDLAQIYNDGYRSLMGGKHPAGLGQPTRLCWPEVWHINEPIYERVWRGESVALEDALFPITRSGVREDAWFTLSYTPVRSDDGDIGGVLVTVFETTKRRRAETLVRETEARFHTFASDSTDALDRMSADWSEQRQLADRLRASEAVQQRILESSGAGLWELDFATGAIAADARMVELMGLPPGGTFDLASGLNEQVVPEDRERVGAAVAAAMAGENDGRYLVEFRTGGRDGVPLRWVESRARVTFDAAGKARSLGGAMIDITERKRSESERERLVEELTRSNTALDQFAHVASHDLRAPLRGIGNLATWIEDDLGDALTDDVRDKLGLMRGRVRHLETMITGILDFATAGRNQTETEPVDIARLVGDVIGLLAPPEQTVIAVVEPMPSLTTERVALQQVVMNLLGNAIKHAQGDHATIRLEARDEGDFVHLTVRDNGPGIDPKDHERIWGLFQKGPSRTKVEGSGIGLAVVKKTVESRGGRVWVESSPGQGATFHVLWARLPATEILSRRRPS